MPKGQSKMDNPEKLATLCTQDEERQNKSTTQYVSVGHHYAQTNTNIVDKTFFLSSVGGLHKQKCRGDCLYAYKCMFF